MFGMSAERNEVERTPRTDTGGTPALRSLCTRKETLLSAIGVPEMIVTHGIYLQCITVKAAPVIKYRPHAPARRNSTFIEGAGVRINIIV